MNDYKESKMNPYLNGLGTALVLFGIVFTLDYSINGEESVILSGLENCVEWFTNSDKEE
jgi:hypothetical protein